MFVETYVRSFKDYIQATASTQAGAAGTAIADLTPVPQGYVHRLIRYSIFSNSAGTPVFELFTANSKSEWLAPNFVFDRTRRQDYTATGKNNVSDNVSPPYYQEGEIPVFAWTGGSNGDICQAMVLIAVFELVPVVSHRDSIAIHHQEQVEDAQRNGAVVVGGSGWNGGLGDTPEDLEHSDLAAWASRDPRDAADDPEQAYLPPGVGQYAGGNELGAQHPVPPFDGRIKPDGSTDS